MIIGGLQKSSLLDYPDKISAIIFTSGCNFRCGYCHNPELVNSRKHIYKPNDILEFLKTRIGKLDAVVITGGEPCLNNDLSDFIQEIKNLGFLVKLDTNGFNPDMLEKVMPFIDYIAMDIKAPLDKYEKITNVKIDTAKIKESISLIMSSHMDYEFRTTVVKSLLSYDDFIRIGDLINGARRYYLQKFIPSKTLDKSFMSEASYTDAEFQEIISYLRKKIHLVEYR